MYFASPKEHEIVRNAAVRSGSERERPLLAGGRIDDDERGAGVFVLQRPQIAGLGIVSQARRYGRRRCKS